MLQGDIKAAKENINDFDELLESERSTSTAVLAECKVKQARHAAANEVRQRQKGAVETLLSLVQGNMPMLRQYLREVAKTKGFSVPEDKDSDLMNLDADPLVCYVMEGGCWCLCICV